MRRILPVLLAIALASPSAAGAATAHAYSLGPQTVQVSEWDGSHHAVDVALKGLIAVPAGSGPAGVVVIEHGSYSDCRTPAGVASPDSTYPCPPGRIEIDNAAGLASLASSLANAGFIALTLDANSAFPMDTGKRYGDGFESSTTGAFDMRSQLVELHLAALKTASDGGENLFGVALRGRADMTRVGLAGHSRGGQGVLEEALRSHPGFTLRALLLISPTNFLLETPPDVPLHVVLSSCDGDVWNLAGASYYDRARLGTRSSPISQTLLRGANHNWYTTAWSPGTKWSFDDAPTTPECAGRLVPTARPSAIRQQQVLADLAAAFFRRHLAGAPPSALLGERGLPTRIDGLSVVASYDPPSARRVDIDRPADRTHTAFGTAVKGRRLTLGYRTLSPPPISANPPVRWSPHGLAVRTVRWRAKGGRVSYGLPAPDIRAENALSLRLAVDTWSSAHAARVDVVLRDRAGHRRSIRITIGTERPVSGAYRKAVLGTVRIGLGRFRGVDLRRLSSLELRPVGRRGALLVADLAFVRIS